MGAVRCPRAWPGLTADPTLAGRVTAPLQITLSSRFDTEAFQKAWSVQYYSTVYVQDLSFLQLVASVWQLSKLICIDLTISLLDVANRFTHVGHLYTVLYWRICFSKLFQDSCVLNLTPEQVAADERAYFRLELNTASHFDMWRFLSRPRDSLHSPMIHTHLSRRWPLIRRVRLLFIHPDTVLYVSVLHPSPPFLAAVGARIKSLTSSSVLSPTAGNLSTSQGSPYRTRHGNIGGETNRQLCHQSSCHS